MGSVWAAWLRSTRVSSGVSMTTTRVQAADAQCTGNSTAHFDITCSGTSLVSTFPTSAVNCSAVARVLAASACSLPSPALAAAAPWWWHGAGTHSNEDGTVNSINGNGVCTAADGSGMCSAGMVDAVSGAVQCPAGFQACTGDPVFSAGTDVHSVQTCVPCGGSRLVAVASVAAQTAASASTAASVYAGGVCSGHGTCLAAEGGVWPPQTPEQLLGTSHLGSTAATRAFFDSIAVTESKLLAATAGMPLTLDNATMPMRSAAASLFVQAANAAVSGSTGSLSWGAVSGSSVAVPYAASLVHASRGSTSFLRDYAAPMSLQWVAPFVNSHAVVGGGHCVCAAGWAGPDCGVHVASSAQVDNAVPMQGGAGGSLAVNSTDASGVDAFVPLVALAACAGDSTCSGHGVCRHRREYQQYRLFTTLPAKQGSIGIESAFDTFLNPDSRFWPSSILQCTCVAGWTGDRCHIPLSPSAVADGAASLPLPVSTLANALAVSRWEADPVWAECSAQCNSGSTFRSTACSARGASVLHQGTPAALCESVLYDGPTRGSDVSTSSDLLAEVYASSAEAGAPPQFLPPAAAVNGSCSRFVRPSISRTCRSTACGTSVASLSLPLSSVTAAAVDAVLSRAGTLTGAGGALALSGSQRYGAQYSFHRVTGGASAGINSAVHMWDDGAVAEAFVTAVAVDVAATLGISVTRIQITAVSDRNIEGDATEPASSCGGLGSQATCAAGMNVLIEVVDGRVAGEAASPAALDSLVAASKTADSALRAGVQSLYSVAASVRDRAAPAGTTSTRLRLRALQSTLLDDAGIPRLSASAGQLDEAAVASAAFAASSSPTADITGEAAEDDTTFTVWEIVGILVALLVGVLILGCGMYYCWLCSVRSDPKNKGKYQAIKARTDREKKLATAEKARAAKAKSQAKHTKAAATAPQPVAGTSAGSSDAAGPPGGGRTLGRRGRPPLAPSADAASVSSQQSPSPVLHDFGEGSHEGGSVDAFRPATFASSAAEDGDASVEITHNALTAAPAEGGGKAAEGGWDQGGVKPLKQLPESDAEEEDSAVQDDADFVLSPDSPLEGEAGGRETPEAGQHTALLGGGASQHEGGSQDGAGGERAPLSPGDDSPDMVASMFETLATDGGAEGGADGDDSDDSDADNGELQEQEGGLDAEAARGDDEEVAAGADASLEDASAATAAQADTEDETAPLTGR